MFGCPLNTAWRAGASIILYSVADGIHLKKKTVVSGKGGGCFSAGKTWKLSLFWDWRRGGGGGGMTLSFARVSP